MFPTNVTELFDSELKWNNIQNALVKNERYAYPDSATEEWHYSNTLLFDYDTSIQAQNTVSGVTVVVYGLVDVTEIYDDVSTIGEVRLFSNNVPISLPRYVNFALDTKITLGGKYDIWGTQGETLRQAIANNTLQVGVRTISGFAYPIRLDSVELLYNEILSYNEVAQRRIPLVALNQNTSEIQTIPWQNPNFIITPGNTYASIRTAPDGGEGVYYSEELQAVWTSLFGAGLIPVGFEIIADVEYVNADRDSKINYITVNDKRFDLEIPLENGRYEIIIGGPNENFDYFWTAQRYRAFKLGVMQQFNRRVPQETRVYTVRLTAYTAREPLVREIIERLYLNDEIDYKLKKDLYESFNIEFCESLEHGCEETPVLCSNGQTDNVETMCVVLNDSETLERIRNAVSSLNKQKGH